MTTTRIYHRAPKGGLNYGGRQYKGGWFVPAAALLTVEGLAPICGGAPAVEIQPIRLTARADYGQTGQYIARIAGQDRKYGLAREFVGRKDGTWTQHEAIEPGLYEIQDVRSKGRKRRSWTLVLLTDAGLDEYTCDESDALRIARDLDAGKAIGAIVQGDSEGWEYVS